MLVNHQNMNLPLTDYDCHSSHNTYLTGNQITSESSVEMYSYVLKNGCRFLDLDTFDGREGDKAEPIITHWHFPVGDISFKDALIVIKEHAFIKSEYPVILSLESNGVPVKPIRAAVGNNFIILSAKIPYWLR